MAGKPPARRPHREPRAPKRLGRMKLNFSYKDVAVLGRFLTEQGYIVSAERTGLSDKQQRQLTLAIKHARHLAMLPFTQTL